MCLCAILVCMHACVCVCLHVCTSGLTAAVDIIGKDPVVRECVEDAVQFVPVAVLDKTVLYRNQHSVIMWEHKLKAKNVSALGTEHAEISQRAHCTLK